METTTTKTALPTDSAARKDLPLARGVLDYFPAALAEVARLSKAGNDKHNPGEDLHWARGKSMDHADCIMRHLAERGTIDTDGITHSAKVAWRALALLQEELEAAGAPMARGARVVADENSDAQEWRLTATEQVELLRILATPAPAQEEIPWNEGWLCECGEKGLWHGMTPEIVARRVKTGAGPLCARRSCMSEMQRVGVVADNAPPTPLHRAPMNEPKERAWNEGWTCPRCGTTELWIDETPYTVRNGRDVLCATPTCLGHMERE